MKQDIRSIALAICCSALLCGCQTMEKPSVIAATGTTIGFDISQNAGTGAPQTTLGYKRAEVAIVSEQKLVSAGSEDVANVVMELHYQNKTADGSIYQRLAVGKAAVSGAGAAMLFAKKPDGTIDPAAAAAVSAAIEATSDPANFDSNP